MSYVTDPSKWKDITPEMYDEINAEIDETFAEGCHGNCASCETGCDDQNSNHLPIFAKRMYIVTGGKGGTGKSTVAVMLAYELARQGLKVGLLDCDLCCSTVPQLMGLEGQVLSGEDQKMIPVTSPEGIQVMSFNLIEPDRTAAVLWPSGDQSNVVQYMYSGTAWADLDVMIVDMPAGGGSVPLNLFTSFPLSGTIVVTNPGALAVGPVQRSIAMYRTLLAAPVALVENKAWDETPSCHEMYDLPPMCMKVALPLSAEITALGDEGQMAKADCAPLQPVVEYVKNMVAKAV